MSKPVLYSVEISPPCRAVLMTAEAVGVNFDIKEVNLLKTENKNPEFTKINPAQTIPVLNDNGVIICDSHAIICYLANKYGKNDSLYPKDLAKRALVDQYLHYDSGVIFMNLKATTRPIVFEGKTPVPKERMNAIGEVFAALNKILEGKQWLTGDSYTLADISCMTSVLSLTVYQKVDSYPNVKSWLQNCEKNLPGYEKWNVKGNKQLHELISQKLAGAQ